MQRQSLQHIGFATLFFLLVASCMLLDIAVVHDSRIMMKWFVSCVVSILFAASLFLWGKRQQVRIRIVDLAVVLLLLYILIYDYSRGDLSQPILLRIVALALLYLVFRQSIGENLLNTCYAIFLMLASVLAVWGIVQFVLAVIHHQPLHTAVVGSFDNTAGLALALSLSLPVGAGLLSLSESSPLQRYCIHVALGVILLALLLSASRTAWLSALCTGVYVYSLREKKKRRWIGLFLAVTSLSVGLLYLFKQDSADGRSYIALCTEQLIADAPWWGHGRYGFSAGYMACQAEYLSEHPDSRFAWLADNVRHPFNEWLYLIVRYGIIGIMLLIGILLTLLPGIRHELRSRRILPIGLLVALFPFTLFSYPMQYPLAWVTLTLAVASLARLTRSVCHLSVRWVFPAFSLLLACASVPLFYRTIHAELEWHDVTSRSLAGQTRYVLPRYEALYSTLRHSPHFLYNYAAELNYIGEYCRSQQVLDECMCRMDDYDTRLLAASNHEHMDNYELCELHLRKASAMCPVRFVPLYRLAKLYQTMGRHEELHSLARQIMDKEVKVPSRRVTEIKDEMRYILEEADTQ